VSIPYTAARSVRPVAARGGPLAHRCHAHGPLGKGPVPGEHREQEGTCCQLSIPNTHAPCGPCTTALPGWPVSHDRVQPGSGANRLSLLIRYPLTGSRRSRAVGASGL
jgi:hypothetical protein